VAAPPEESLPLSGGSLPKLRAMLELARTLQSSHSTDDVLSAVVDAALAVTGCERGFLLLRNGDDLEVRVGRSHSGPLSCSALCFPTRLLMRALQQRKDFLSMNFDPDAGPASAFEQSVMVLELRSIVCLPLVRVRTSSPEATRNLTMDDTVGLLYMDSRLRPADLSAGGRELLTTLALEASTVLENARLIEEQWSLQRMEEELRIARQMQERLLPRTLPAAGWFRGAAASIPSLQVGGDYLDAHSIDPRQWAAVMADVSGKGVGAALLASLLQGMFMAAPYTQFSMEEVMFRVSRFLYERTGGEQYVTLFYCTLAEDGRLRWVNGGHPPPLVVRAAGAIEKLVANGLPLGMLEGAAYKVEEARLCARDKLVVYSDGLTEARNAAGDMFGIKRLRGSVLAHRDVTCHEMHAEILAAVEDFTRGAEQNDDISLGVFEYRPE
jgi:serine phosphatase RsbU (regulator of sigma subunit)